MLFFSFSKGRAMVHIVGFGDVSDRRANVARLHASFSMLKTLRDLVFGVIRIRRSSCAES